MDLNILSLEIEFMDLTFFKSIKAELIWRNRCDLLPDLLPRKVRCFELACRPDHLVEGSAADNKRDGWDFLENQFADSRDQVVELQEELARNREPLQPDVQMAGVRHTVKLGDDIIDQRPTFWFIKKRQ